MLPLDVRIWVWGDRKEKVFNYMDYSPEEIKQMYQSDGLLEINHLNRATNKREWIVIGVYIIPGETLGEAAKRTFEDFCFNMGKNLKISVVVKKGIITLLYLNWVKKYPSHPKIHLVHNSILL